MVVETNQRRDQNKTEVKTPDIPDELKIAAGWFKIKKETSEGTAHLNSSVILDKLKKWVGSNPKNAIVRKESQKKNGEWLDSLIANLPKWLYELIWWNVFQDWSLEIKISKNWILQKIYVEGVEYVLNPGQWDILNKEFEFWLSDNWKDKLLVVKWETDKNINLTKLKENIDSSDTQIAYSADLWMSWKWDITFEKKVV